MGASDGTPFSWIWRSVSPMCITTHETVDQSLATSIARLETSPREYYSGHADLGVLI